MTDEPLSSFLTKPESGESADLPSTVEHKGKIKLVMEHSFDWETGLFLIIVLWWMSTDFNHWLDRAYPKPPHAEQPAPEKK